MFSYNNYQKAHLKDHHLPIPLRAETYTWCDGKDPWYPTCPGTMVHHLLWTVPRILLLYLKCQTVVRCPCTGHCGCSVQQMYVLFAWSGWCTVWHDIAEGSRRCACADVCQTFAKSSSEARHMLNSSESKLHQILPITSAVKPWYNELGFNEMCCIMNDFKIPSNSRTFHVIRHNKNPIITNLSRVPVDLVILRFYYSNHANILEQVYWRVSFHLSESFPGFPRVHINEVLLFMFNSKHFSRNAHSLFVIWILDPGQFLIKF